MGLEIKGFATFQHYRDRNPPWIKLYGALLSDSVFLELPEAAQAQLVKLWLLASQMGHPLPDNPKLIAGRIGTTGRFYLKELLASGFILRVQSASAPLAESSQNARTLDREERRELEKELPPQPREGPEQEIAALLTSDHDRAALTAVVLRAPSAFPCALALLSILVGNDPATPQPTPEQFGQALRDFATNSERWNVGHFRGYLKRAVPRPEAPAKSAPRAVAVFGKIRTLIREQVAPGQPTSRFIPKEEVLALGAEVWRAYQQVGGARAFTECAPDKLSFLQRDFVAALEAA